MRYAMIDRAGLVLNVTEWDGAPYDPVTGLGWSPPADVTMVASDTASPGDTYAIGVFTAPVPVVRPVVPTLPEVLAAELPKVRDDPALNAASRAALDAIVAAAVRS